MNHSIGKEEIVQCWGCSAKLAAPRASALKDENRFSCAYCGAITALHEQPLLLRARGVKRLNESSAGFLVNTCLVVPLRFFTRLVGRMLWIVVSCLVFFLVKQTWTCSIPKLTVERERGDSSGSSSGSSSSLRVSDGAYDVSVAVFEISSLIALRAVLALACVNIYWNYAVSIASQAKSVRALREEGLDDHGDDSNSSSSNSSSSDCERGEVVDSNSSKSLIVPIPWCQRCPTTITTTKRTTTESTSIEEDYDDVENEVHPTSVVARDSFRMCSYCIKCDDVKPYGTSHCSTCNKCIVDLDHHCPFLQNCVGKHNVRAFICFCLWCSIGCTLAFVIAIALPFTTQRHTFRAPYEKVLGDSKYSYEYVGRFPTSTIAIVQYFSFILRYISQCEETWIGTWCVVVLATATIAPLTGGLFYQTLLAVKQGEFYVASLKAKRDAKFQHESGLNQYANNNNNMNSNNNNNLDSLAREATGMGKRVEDARLRAVFERRKGEHWIFWFLFPRISNLKGFIRRRKNVQKLK